MTTGEPRDLVEAAREFARTELADRDEVPADVARRLHDAGLSNWWIRPEHGGSGLSFADGVELTAALAYGDAGTAISSIVPTIPSLATEQFGRPEWAGPILESMSRTGVPFAILGSERDAGSEMSAIGTTATPDGDGWVLHGGKMFSANAAESEHLMVVARAPQDGDLHSYVAVVLPRDQPGVRVDRRWALEGLPSSPVYELTLDGCRARADHVLDGHGIRMLEVGLNPSRLLIAASALGMARRVRDLVIDYGRARPFRGGRLAGHATFADRVGRMEIEIEVMASQCRAAAAELDGLRARPDAAAVLARRGALRSVLAAKEFCGRVGWELASSGSEMFGGLGYSDEFPIMGILRDMRCVGLAEGGTDMLREQVYRRFALPAGRRA